MRFIQAPVRTCGLTQRGCGTPLNSMRAGNKATPSCHFCSAWGSEEVRLEDGECLFAFLDNINVLSSPKRTRVISDLLATTLRERAGIQLHTGKTRIWAEEWKLWDAIPSIPELQCSWQVLVQCAGPRCHHLLRTVPPRQCAGYAHGHDSWMQRTMEALLGRIPGSPMQVEMARNITTLPMRMGGLGQP